MSFLKINGTDVSEYIQTMSITHEPVWSTNAGRTLNGTFVGDIITRKWKINLTTKPLKQKESGIITNLIESIPYFYVDFIPTNQETDTEVRIIMYSGSPSHTLYSYNKNYIRYQGMSFNLIEQ